MAKTKIGVLGSGQVARTLANGFLKHGYEVMMGSRDPEKLRDWKDQNSDGKTGTFAETSAYGDFIVFALKGTAAESVLNADWVKNLAGKTVLDTTNPIADAPPENGVLKFFTDLNSSLMERLQKKVPDANFVKAFSCVGNAFMVDPAFPDGKPTMFICGNNPDAKKEAEKILEQFGFDVSDMGGAEAARAIEPLCILWCLPGFIRNEWKHAFKLLRI